MEVTVGSTVRPVHIEYKRSRNMYLRVREDGSLYVTCPVWTDPEDIAAFIHDKEKWILKTQASEKRRSSKFHTGSNGKDAMWLGRQYAVRFESASRSSLRFEGDTIVYSLKNKDVDEINRTFYHYASKTLSKMIAERRDEWDQKICRANGKPVPRITIRYMTSRWGSCTPAKNHISMSVRLIHFPSEALDYVLLHEYVHILVPNHSKQFYDTVASFMPDWKYGSDLLK